MALCVFITQHESGDDYQTVVYPYTVKYSESLFLFLMSFHGADGLNKVRI